MMVTLLTPYATVLQLHQLIGYLCPTLISLQQVILVYMSVRVSKATIRALACHQDAAPRWERM